MRGDATTAPPARQRAGEEGGLLLQHLETGDVRPGDAALRHGEGGARKWRRHHRHARLPLAAMRDDEIGARRCFGEGLRTPRRLRLPQRFRRQAVLRGGARQRRCTGGSASAAATSACSFAAIGAGRRGEAEPVLRQQTSESSLAGGRHLRRHRLPGWRSHGDGAQPAGAD
jgi:hypothetical protein